MIECKTHANRLRNITASIQDKASKTHQVADK